MTQRSRCSFHFTHQPWYPYRNTFLRIELCQIMIIITVITESNINVIIFYLDISIFAVAKSIPVSAFFVNLFGHTHKHIISKYRNKFTSRAIFFCNSRVSWVSGIRSIFLRIYCYRFWKMSCTSSWKSDAYFSIDLSIFFYSCN